MNRAPKQRSRPLRLRPPWLPILEGRGFTCRSEVVEGHPVRALLELAEREQSSMVVVGSRGLGRWKRLALGSVTDALARHADAAFVGRPATLTTADTVITSQPCG